MKMTNSVNDSLGMEVVQAVKDLSGEGLCHILVESAVLSQGAGDRTTRNVFKEARKSLSVVGQL